MRVLQSKSQYEFEANETEKIEFTLTERILKICMLLTNLRTIQVLCVKLIFKIY